ncbi:Major Facilitator Superfamily protein [Glycomyces sambucus]|uniref:Major Facilitator Superfamily protein n=1 Tax=Glycomyces sambucus TaxID=380244 RepID=A0A1G9E200_9ACTN|nr:MFS transporter [Glycomyces sambucus]SDK70129.1 Major Facilitator Superfamily protein [Glycomyces sambucus]
MALDSTPAPPLPPPPPAAGPAPAPNGFVLRAALSNWSLWTALLTPGVLTLAIRVPEIVGDDYEAAYSLVISTGIAVGMLGAPLWGRLSDRTRSRFGRRRPWIAGGALAGVAGTLVVAFAPDLRLLLPGWVLAQAGFNAALAATMAIMPERIPAAAQGRASGAFGAAITGGFLTGSAIAAVTQDTTVMFLLPCALVLVLTGAFALTLDDPKVDAPPKPFSPKEFASSFGFDPRRHPQFGWVWLTKFCFIFGIVAPSTYMVYFLAARLDLTAAAAAAVVGLVFVVNFSVQTGVVLATGWLSDRLGRRRPFAAAAGLLLAAGLLTMAFADGLPQILAGQAFLTVAGGLFAAMDGVLVFQTLPDPAAPAKDLGVANLANGLPGALLPPLATALLAMGDTEYTLLFVICAGSALAAVLALGRVTSVR